MRFHPRAGTRTLGAGLRHPRAGTRTEPLSRSKNPFDLRDESADGPALLSLVQMSAWVALDNRRKTFAVLVVAVAIASVAYALIIRNVIFGAQAVTAIDELGEAAAAAVAAGACAWAASRARGRDRLGWTLMAIS